MTTRLNKQYRNLHIAFMATLEEQMVKRGYMTPPEAQLFVQSIEILANEYIENYEDPNDYRGMGWVGQDGRP
jgi:hypothetical protein